MSDSSVDTINEPGVAKLTVFTLNRVAIFFLVVLLLLVEIVYTIDVAE